MRANKQIERGEDDEDEDEDEEEKRNRETTLIKDRERIIEDKVR